MTGSVARFSSRRVSCPNSPSGPAISSAVLSQQRIEHLVEVTRNADWCAPDERSTGALASPSRFLAMNRLSYACSVANSMVRSATSR